VEYKECIEDLYSLVDYERVDDYPREFDLSHYRDFLASVGSPHRRLRNPIIVTGTKGKGSTIEIMASCLEVSNRRAGVFTSPHLVDVRERIRIDRQKIPKERFAAIYESLRPFVRRKPGGYRTVFEVLTAIAFKYFGEVGVDYAILEVGMGGTGDATNVVDPVLSVVTPISLDHMHVLGNTVREIAEKKMGVARQGVPVVCAPQCDEALSVIERISRELGTRALLVGRDLAYSPIQCDSRGSTFEVDGSVYSLNLLGEHQVDNAATAYLALKALGEDVREEGFRHVELKGRLQVIQQDPIVVLDAAHNAHSAGALARAMTGLFGGRPVTAVVSMLKRKDLTGFARELAPALKRIYATRVDSPRALAPEELASAFRGVVDSVEVVEDSREAYRRAVSSASPQDVVLVTGSFYLVGEVLACVEARSAQ
jgi:dihydrofolate synthase/folylpolyglutamate synthase